MTRLPLPGRVLLAAAALAAAFGVSYGVVHHLARTPPPVETPPAPGTFAPPKRSPPPAPPPIVAPEPPPPPPTPADPEAHARAVETFLHDPDTNRRLRAAEALGREGESGVRVLADYLTTAAETDFTEGLVIQTAVKAIAPHRGPDRPPRVDRILGASRDPTVHRFVLMSLYYNPTDAEGARLAAAWAEKDLANPALAEVARDILARLSARGYVPLGGFLASIGFDESKPEDMHRDPGRVAALVRVAQSSPERLPDPAREDLVKVLRSPYRPPVRIAAAEALLRAGDADRVRALLPELERDMPGIRGQLQIMGLRD
jgi:HEAT repeat protein